MDFWPIFRWARNARAACADALGKRALWVELESQLAGEILLLEQLVLTDIRRDHLSDLARLKEVPQPEPVCARIVRDDGEIPNPGRFDHRNQALRIADEAEATGHDGHSVSQQPIKCRFG